VRNLNPYAWVLSHGELTFSTNLSARFQQAGMAKAIREADGKGLLFKYFRTLLESEGLGRDLVLSCKTATVTADTDFSKLVTEYPWLGTEVGLHHNAQLRSCLHTQLGERGRVSTITSLKTLI